ncbi:MAG: hypothetical protein JXM70_26930 [Pirellulales bacterium]|nr:hypothetical protein [Pirellulales bacterium]
MNNTLCLLGGITLLICGCGDAEISHVMGKVTYNGQPVTAGLVSFEPVEGGSLPYGISIHDGRYTSSSGSRIKPGKYIVRITAPDLSRSNLDANAGPNDPVPPTVPLVPASWNVQSKLSLDLRPGINEINFSGEKMTPPKVERLDPQ